MELSESQLQRDWRNERLIMAPWGAGWGHRHPLITNQIRFLSLLYNSKWTPLTLSLFIVILQLNLLLLLGLWEICYNTQKWVNTVICSWILTGMFIQNSRTFKNVLYDWYIYARWKVEDLKYYLGRCGLPSILLLTGGIASVLRLLCCKVCMHTWKLSSHQWQSRLFLSVTNDWTDYSTSGASFGVF